MWKVRDFVLEFLADIVHRTMSVRLFTDNRLEEHTASIQFAKFVDEMDRGEMHEGLDKQMTTWML